MKIIYRWSANRDLYDIKSYYDEISPRTAIRVYSDITDTLLALQTFPLSGHKVPGRPERRIITSKYRYVISHISFETHIEIIGVFRYQDRAV